MIELPEAFVLTKQMQAELPGRRIVRCVANQSPHRFAFYRQPPEQIPSKLEGRTIVEVTHNQGHWLQIELDRGWLDFGDMGGRILLHAAGEAAPPKHQLLLELDDGRKLTASIVLWGFIHAAAPGEKRGPETQKAAPLADDFTFERFRELFKDPSVTPKTSLKYFIISKPGLSGIGNGCLQDILFNARLHPKRTVLSLTDDEQRRLYDTIQSTLRQMIDQGGRDSDRDLYNRPGGYQTLLGSHAVGKACPRCGAAIEKSSFLGGAAYFCPGCQI
jgi:formamidopyrimidine-DNA glycosylase